MYEELILKNIYNSFVDAFINDNAQRIELLKLGFIPNKCNTDKMAILIHCIDNIKIFNTEQIANINTMLNKYGSK